MAKKPAKEYKVGERYIDPYTKEKVEIVSISQGPGGLVSFMISKDRGVAYHGNVLLEETKRLKRAPGPIIGKGNSFEWVTARKISKWLTGGADDSQLIRSVMSGGHIRLRESSENQVGDIAPNGPRGKWFRDHFGIECKNYKADPNWWHAITYKTWMVEDWWKKIGEECKPLRLEPLLVMLRNGHPTVVLLHTDLCERMLIPAQLIIPRLRASVITMEQFCAQEPEKWVHVKGLIRV